MLKTWFISLATACIVAAPGWAFEFRSIDGGTIDLDAFQGQPVLVVNTASMCAFTKQYEGLQELYDTYRNAGLVVLGVPSDDFNQEFSDADAVKDFCDVNFGLDMPMTDITHVRGGDAHPFYQWVRETAGFQPRWNFNKILLDGRGEIVGTYGSSAKPMGREITRAVEGVLNAS